jgi:LPXTG-motif cell wall-anchored protein
MRKSALFAFAVAAMLCLAPSAAHAAAPASIDSTETDVTDGYTPNEPDEPTLAGSTAVGECERDVPWISYAVELTDPDQQATGNTARLVITDGTNTATLVLGDLVDGKLSGRILWPGASVDGAGNATGWPGWAFVDGTWVETDGNYRWTRGNISAKITVNPEVAVPLSYPPATPVCAAAPETPMLSPDSPEPTVAGFLPATGLGASLLPIAVVGGLLAAIGLIVVAARRRHRANG